MKYLTIKISNQVSGYENSIERRDNKIVLYIIY